ncbi:MAG: hypothetical protein ABIG69_17890 [Bacteroidota bacterium]
MKNLLNTFIVLFVVIGFVGCASFTPGSLNTTSAISTPDAIVKDSVSVFVKEISPKESERIFDCDIHGEGYQPLSIAISNRSNSSIEFIPSSLPQYINAEEVLSATDFSPIIRVFTWSIPWIINLAASQPFYYGIAWPVFGLIDMGKANRANDDRADFFNNIVLKPTKLQPGQDIQGVSFFRKNYPSPLQIILLKNGNQLIFDIYPAK